jgi:hypothetical protein
MHSQKPRVGGSGQLPMELAKIRVCLNEAGRLEHRHSSSEFGSVQVSEVGIPVV